LIEKAQCLDLTSHRLSAILCSPVYLSAQLKNTDITKNWSHSYSGNLPFEWRNRCR